MNLLELTVGAGLILLAAYFSYGRWVARKLELRDDVPTPACEINDGLDFVPTPAPYLFSQHFSAIAAAGPIVGPITAGLLFGWGPAILWILIGSIFIGGVHDMASLIASVRHKARSIAEIVREHVSRRAFLLFLAFVWIALVYIVVAFTDLTATTFAPKPPAPLAAGASEAEQTAFTQGMEDVRTGQAVASSSMLYLLLAVVMGFVLRYTKLSLGWATAVFMPLVLASIWAGEYIPLAIPESLWWDGSAAKTWDIVLLVYCGVASVVPVWALLQPRGFLGGDFLSVTILLAFLGIVAGTFMGDTSIAIQYPAFRGGLTALNAAGKGVWLFPVLFVTIACGACSGFHSMISSGTSSKQLRVETDARSIGYGCMLLEAFVAVISLACVMIMAQGASGNPNQIFARGVSRFISFLGDAVGIDREVAQRHLFNFCLLAFATFIYDTLDVCTRLGRYVLQELTGWQGTAGRLGCTVLTLVPPLYLVLQTLTTVDPKTGQEVAVPAWSMFWTLFGTANQLLAALTLLGVTVWLIRTGKTWWYTAVPAVFMMGVTFTSLGTILWAWLQKFRSAPRFDANGPLSTLLFGLALLLVIEAVMVICRNLRHRELSAGSSV